MTEFFESAHVALDNYDVLLDELGRREGLANLLDEAHSRLSQLEYLLKGVMSRVEERFVLTERPAQIQRMLTEFAVAMGKEPPPPLHPKVAWSEEELMRRQDLAFEAELKVSAPAATSSNRGFPMLRCMVARSRSGSCSTSAGDAYDWYLRQGPLTALDSLVKGRFPTWAAFLAHPSYDAYWRARDVRAQINRPRDRRVPTLVVGGRWDQEDPLGPLVTYAALERGDSLGMNTLVLGPWHHGQWSMGGGRRLGALDWGTETGRFFRDSVEAPWFAHWLKDAPAPALPEALVYRSGDDKWDRLARWPAPDATTRALFLHDSGALAFTAPRATAPASDSYVSDPANPVPYRARPIKETFGEGMPAWWTWLAADQRFVAGRPDVRHWQTPPLSEDVTVTGDVVAKLFASTTGSEADWVVKLIDVCPDSTSASDSAMAGYQLMVAGDILRGRYRHSFDRPMPVKPGVVEAYALTLRGVDHTFRRGHRIMVQVQSSWFPLYDRNPQTWVPNIFTAPASAFHSATQRVYRSAKYPSRVELPVAPR